MTRGGFAEAEAAREQRLKTRDRDAEPSRQPRDRRNGKPAANAAGPFAAWRVNKIEARIIANEERMAAIHAAFADPDVIRDGNRMRTFQNELATIEDEQAALEQEYARRG
ncbi:MAG: hypothetical protein LBS30_03690 [Planctomycetota bacterium]|nr:hypothetical protein [Planctomycetota bacterium]